MSDCGPVEFLDGGTITDPTIVNPDINGGISNGQTLANPTITGSLTLDQSVLDQLVTLLKPQLDIPNLTDCNGAPVQSSVASCNDLHTAVAEATDPDKIAGVFRRADDTKFTANAKLMTYQEIIAKINEAIVQAGGQQNDHWYRLNSMTWDPQTRTVSVTETDQDGVISTKSAQITGLAQEFGSAAAAPGAAAEDNTLPLAMYGGRNSLLGTPAKFLLINIGGQAGWVPFYNL